ncbi:MAG: SigB/SigF/SigG family RNA polymerase sigma factor [Clostridia bacterium]|nr:SigB/SigF/SigG family RNA polymerase sigma factor [Clostridia bacterium]
MLSIEDTLLHIRKAKSGNDESKSILIENNILLVKSIVNRFKNKGVEYDDLVQIGSLGLLKAIYNFNESYEVKFSTYAVPLIIGEIKRFLRDDGEIKVSRLIKYNAYKINKFIENYQSKFDNEPTIEEIANNLQLSVDDVILAVNSNKMPVSLYETVDDGQEKSQELIDKIPSKEGEEELVTKIYVKNLLNNLTEREKKIIVLRYFRDKTQGEVAKILGVSQVQVSRLESKILLRLKEFA